MIKLSQIHVPIQHTQADILAEAARQLKVSAGSLHNPVILKKSIDARKKQQIGYSYSIAVEAENEQKLLRKGFEKYVPVIYRYTVTGTEKLSHRPVVVGSGPAGLFCAYLLAREGYRPLLLERGASMEERIRAVDDFHNGGPLDPEANIQFGEGGAGTFSDGKLNTLIKDKDGKGRFVLKTFVDFGAP